MYINISNDKVSHKKGSCFMKKKIGKISIVLGPMFCGKSSEISRRLKRDEIAGRKFSVIKPEIDNRYGDYIYKDRNNAFSCPAINAPVENISEEELESLLNTIGDSEVVAIDEVQFFGNWIVDFVRTLKGQGKKVYLGGLDTDFASEPFGSTGTLCCVADEVMKLTAVCVCCGEDATRSQRLVNGVPAPLGGDKVIIGDKEVKNTISYEARCDEHYVHPANVDFKTAVN